MDVIRVMHYMCKTQCFPNPEVFGSGTTPVKSMSHFHHFPIVVGIGLRPYIRAMV